MPQVCQNAIKLFELSKIFHRITISVGYNRKRWERQSDYWFRIQARNFSLNIFQQIEKKGP